MYKELTPEAEGMIPATFKVETTDSYYPVQCQTCGWIGSSGDCTGGHAIADTGDYGDWYCPVCGQVEPDECEPEMPISAYQEASVKMGTIIKNMIKQRDDEHWKSLGEEIKKQESLQLTQQERRDIAEKAMNHLREGKHWGDPYFHSEVSAYLDQNYPL